VYEGGSWNVDNNAHDIYAGAGEGGVQEERERRDSETRCEHSARERLHGDCVSQNRGQARREGRIASSTRPLLRLRGQPRCSSRPAPLSRFSPVDCETGRVKETYRGVNVVEFLIDELSGAHEGLVHTFSTLCGGLGER
jgi:hypothetical protein